jgi:hypothetical protein
MPTRPVAGSARDPRIDVLRGLTLLMIFVDHMPQDVVNWVTMHNFGFCDAAEVFVLLAGMSSMLAYGKVFERDGAGTGLIKVSLRCLRIYLAQILLLLTTIGVVLAWSRVYHMTPRIIGPILQTPVKGLAHGLTLRALPEYLDILPLYVVLLALFPIVYAAVRRSAWLALIGSAALWIVTMSLPGLDLPNWIDGHGWYFDPFSWQFLFTIGAVLARTLKARDGMLPAIPAARWAAAAFLLFAAIESTPWTHYGLPDLRLFAMDAPDKSRLAPLRIVDILCLFYLLWSSPAVLTFVRRPWARVLEAAGRHSLEVFSVSCVLALFGRLAFNSYGSGIAMEVTVNVLGFATMALVGLSLERQRLGRVAGPAMHRVKPA